MDEVGQCNADNIKLMTVLQKKSESLATTYHEQSWIIVTAQEDMNILGDLSKQQTTDFSKIQARILNQDYAFQARKQEDTFRQPFSDEIIIYK